MILSHFTQRPFRLEKRAYTQDPKGLKPSGLWLSDESQFGWKKWCEENQFNCQRLIHETLFELDFKKVLALKTKHQVKAFSDKYEINYLGFPTIQWERVAQDYSGILISPYQWSLRFDLFWYYSWDCASACVWDLSAIQMRGSACRKKS